MHLQKKCGVILALAVLITLPCVGQNRVSLDVGSVTVWLGMPKSDATKKFSDAGYKVNDTGDAWVLTSNGHVHFLTFRQGSLVFANRSWNTSESIDEVQALMGALSALADKTKTNACSVSHDPLSEPGISVDRIFIACGQTLRSDGTLVVERSVMISVNGFGTNRMVGVVESIGAQPAPK